MQEGLRRAQKLLKQSKKRDYYKILGVRRYVVCHCDIDCQTASCGVCTFSLSFVDTALLHWGIVTTFSALYLWADFDRLVCFVFSGIF